LLAHVAHCVRSGLAAEQVVLFHASCCSVTAWHGSRVLTLVFVGSDARDDSRIRTRLCTGSAQAYAPML